MRNKNVNSVVLSLSINSHHDFDFSFNLMVFLLIPFCWASFLLICIVEFNTSFIEGLFIDFGAYKLCFMIILRMKNEFKGEFMVAFGVFDCFMGKLDYTFVLEGGVLLL